MSDSLAIKVIYEDRDFIVIDKPAAMLTHRARNDADSPAKISTGNLGGQAQNGAEKNTVVDFLLEKYPEIKEAGDDPEIRPGIVHRLDKETSGVMIVARNKEAFDYLKKLFSARGGPASGGQPAIKKTYLALVLGRVKEKTGTISKPIGLKSGTIRRTVYERGSKMAKEAQTKFKVLKYFQFNHRELTLLQVQPLTGRTHQIRIHLNSAGHPVVGDKLYGGKIQRRIAEDLGLARHFLHAESLEFTARNGERINVGAILAKDLAQALNLLSRGQEDRKLHN